MESERQTRKRRIDPLLKRLGWTVAPFNPDRPLQFYQNCAIEEYPTNHGPADYALCVNGEIIGVVEAKKLTLGPQNVLTQAQRYSRGVSGGRYNFDGQFVPFLYSTNGEVIWFQDVGTNEKTDMAVARTPKGFRVAVINHNSGEMEVMLRPLKTPEGRSSGWVDLVSRNKLETSTADRSIKVKVPGRGFRALEFR